MQINHYTSHTGFMEKATGKWYSELYCSEKAFKGFRYATEAEAERFVQSENPSSSEEPVPSGMSQKEEQALLRYANEKTGAEDADLGEAVMRLTNNLK